MFGRDVMSVSKTQEEDTQEQRTRLDQEVLYMILGIRITLHSITRVQVKPLSTESLSGQWKSFSNIGIGAGRGRSVDIGDVDIDIRTSRGWYRCCDSSRCAYIWNVNRVA
jgi:hypothetical protein